MKHMSEKYKFKNKVTCFEDLIKKSLGTVLYEDKMGVNFINEAVYIS